MKAEIIPWPTYDERGTDWWTVRIEDGAKTIDLAFSRRLYRFARGSEFRFARRQNPAGLHAAWDLVTATFGGKP